MGVASLALFKIKNLTYYYPDSATPALSGIDLEIDEGEFILVTGASGSGKSSLARVLAGLVPDFYGGRFYGRVTLRGREVRDIDRRTLTGQVGMVFQDPEKQLVMTGVEAEIAFGLENLGFSQAEMRRRVAEVTGFLGLGRLKKEYTANLSGGEKQKLILAAVLAMHPRVLVLDEPTSQLDPLAAEDLFNLLKRLNEELGYTIILIEQRLERCFHLAGRVLVMSGGKILRDDSPAGIAGWASGNDLRLMPPVPRLFSAAGFANIPVTVAEGRKKLKKIFKQHSLDGGASRYGQADVQAAGCAVLMELRNIWFSYPGGREALRDVSLQIHKGEFVAVLGENGAGKSTMLKNMAGLLRPDRGKVIFKGKAMEQNNPGPLIAFLSQNPNDYLFQDTVEEELFFTLKNFGLPDDGIVEQLLDELKLSGVKLANPRDLSSGERQRVALASILAARPELLILDEPTRGLDYRLKSELGAFLAGLVTAGKSVVLVTHDVEFAAEYATRVVMMSDGNIVSAGPTHEVMEESVFFTTQIGKLFRDFHGGVLTFEEAAAVLKAHVKEEDKQ